jgi:quercetin dioxygenase-like cupin family protein
MQFFTIGLILVSLTSYGSALVINSADLLPKKHPKGATIKSFTSNQKHFAGLLTLPANGKVPVHRDPTVEMLYFIKGSGTIWIDGKAYIVKPGSFIYMPAKAEVKFEGKEAAEIFQVFAPAGPEAKYQSWK